MLVYEFATKKDRGKGDRDVKDPDVDKKDEVGLDSNDLFEDEDAEDDQDDTNY